MRRFLNKHALVRICFLSLIFFTVPGITPLFAQGGYGQYDATAQRIDNIEIAGAQRIEASTVMTYLDIRVGDRMTNDNLDKALKSLFSTGLFADVQLRQRGNTLIVDVTENPVINEISFEGNDKLTDDELRMETQLRSRQVFTRSKVQSDVKRLYQLYRRSGRFSATIEPKAIQLEQNRINLVFEIDEGPVTKVQAIKFVGNKKYDDDKLRTVISTKEDRWYRFLTSDDRYDPDRMAFDQELMRRFYLSEGYADFRVVSATAELTKKRDGFYLTYTVDEGVRYKVGNIAVKSDLRHFDGDLLKPAIGFKSGDWYDAQKVKSTVTEMTDILGDNQYAFVNIRPATDRNREERTIDITFEIQETPRVFVERIDIRGNVRTLDKVIRREMDLVEGDPFSRTKLAESEQDIRDLGYFETVTITPVQGSAPDKTVIDIEVAEQSTGELSIGAGFSTADGPLADFSIRERNFLGKGQEVGFSTTLAGERTEFDLSFTEPYFLNRDFSAGVDLFHMTRDLQDESSYDQQRTGGSLRFGYPLSENVRQSIYYKIEENDIKDVQSTASRFVREQEGTRLTSLFGQRLIYDDRDSRLFPTEGLYSWLQTEIAGAGGDAQYVSGRLGSSYYYPVIDKWVFNLLGEVGAIGGYGNEDVKINERFFLGGSTLRGFEQAGVGPRDTDTNDSLGGNYFYRASAEVSFPLGLPEELGVKGHAFTDVGSIWGLDSTSGANIEDEASLRGAAGFGLSWRSPMGPLRLDIATPFVKEDYDEDEVFSINFGTRF